MPELRRVPCKRCHEPIVFIQSKKGRAIPCDPDLGSYTLKTGVVVVTPDGQVLRGGPESKDTIVQGYTSHFASCSYSEEFRKPKEKVQS